MILIHHSHHFHPHRHHIVIIIIIIIIIIIYPNCALEIILFSKQTFPYKKFTI